MGKSSKHVLLIDDESRFLDMTRQFLEFAGIRTTAVENTTEAMEEMVRQPADAVILDLCMPEEGGMDFLPRFKKSYPQVPVIIMTGAGYDDQTIQDALQNGASGYVGKMAGLHHMMDALRSTLKTNVPLR